MSDFKKGSMNTAEIRNAYTRSRPIAAGTRKDGEEDIWREAVGYLLGRLEAVDKYLNAELLQACVGGEDYEVESTGVLQDRIRELMK